MSKELPRLVTEIKPEDPDHPAYTVAPGCLLSAPDNPPDRDATPEERKLIEIMQNPNHPKYLLLLEASAARRRRLAADLHELRTGKKAA